MNIDIYNYDINDELHGEYVTHHINNNVFMKGHFIHGKRMGLWLWYKEDKVVRHKIFFI